MIEHGWSYAPVEKALRVKRMKQPSFIDEVVLRTISREPMHIKKRVGTSHDAIELIRPLIVDRLQEHFIGLALDAKNRVIAWSTIGVGSITACPVAPSDALRFAVLSGGPAIIFAHNHPSGDPHPSPEDIALTDRLVTGARVLGIHIVDHIIVGSEGHFSFLDAGLLSRRVGP